MNTATDDLRRHLRRLTNPGDRCGTTLASVEAVLRRVENPHDPMPAGEIVAEALALIDVLDEVRAEDAADEDEDPNW